MGSLAATGKVIRSSRTWNDTSVIPAVAVLSGFEPRFQVFDLPFLFNNKKEVYKALDGPLGDKLNALLPLGIKNLAYREWIPHDNK